MKNITEKFHKKYIKYQTEARPREAKARPSQLKKTASRPPRAEADASRTPSLIYSGLVVRYFIDNLYSPSRAVAEKQTT